MRPGNKLGFKLFTRLLFFGILAGLLLGYLLDEPSIRQDILADLPYPGTFIGGFIGLLVALVGYYLSRRVLFEFIAELRDKLSAVGQLPFGFDQDISLKDQANGFYDLFEHQVSRIANFQQRVHQLSARAREALNSASKLSEAPLDSYIKLLENKFEGTNRLIHQLEDFSQRIEKKIIPVVAEGLPEIELGDSSIFEQMVEFQSSIDQTLSDVMTDFREVKDTVDSTRPDPGQLRQAIKRANSIIQQMAELFVEFPAEQLPETAEKLRIQTETWEKMAVRLETLNDSLDSSVNNAVKKLDSLVNQADNLTETEAVWKTLKDNLQTVDDKLTGLNTLVDSQWVSELQELLDKLLKDARWLEDSLYQLRDEMEQEADRIQPLSLLAAELDNLFGKSVEQSGN